MLVGFHVLKYLKSSSGNGLFFSSTSVLKLKGFSYSDQGVCPDIRISATSFYFFLDSSLISWKNKKQTVVSRSSSEAEYRVLTQSTCEGKCILYLLQDFQVKHSSLIVIYYDNKSALHIATKSIFYERTKHIEIDCHILRDKVQAEIIHLLPIASKKPSSKHPNLSTPFNNIQNKLGMIHIYSNLREC